MGLLIWSKEKNDEKSPPVKKRRTDLQLYNGSSGGSGSGGGGRGLRLPFQTGTGHPPLDLGDPPFWRASSLRRQNAISSRLPPLAIRATQRGRGLNDDGDTINASPSANASTNASSSAGIGSRIGPNAIINSGGTTTLPPPFSNGRQRNIESGREQQLLSRLRRGDSNRPPGYPYSSYSTDNNPFLVSYRNREHPFRRLHIDDIGVDMNEDEDADPDHEDEDEEDQGRRRRGEGLFSRGWFDWSLSESQRLRNGQQVQDQDNNDDNNRNSDDDDGEIIQRTPQEYIDGGDAYEYDSLLRSYLFSDQQMYDSDHEGDFGGPTYGGRSRRLGESDESWRNNMHWQSLRSFRRLRQLRDRLAGNFETARGNTHPADGDDGDSRQRRNGTVSSPSRSTQTTATTSSQSEVPALPLPNLSQSNSNGDFPSTNDPLRIYRAIYGAEPHGSVGSSSLPDAGTGSTSSTSSSDSTSPATLQQQSLRLQTHDAVNVQQEQQPNSIRTTSLSSTSSFSTPTTFQRRLGNRRRSVTILDPIEGGTSSRVEAQQQHDDQEQEQEFTDNNNNNDEDIAQTIVGTTNINPAQDRMGSVPSPALRSSTTGSGVRMRPRSRSSSSTRSVHFTDPVADLFEDSADSSD